MYDRDQGEPTKVYAELVGALFTASLPLAVMTLTFIVVGVCTAMIARDAVAASILIVGCGASTAKIWMHIAFRRTAHHTELDHDIVLAWERRFAAGNLAYAAAIGSLAARTFELPFVELQMLATGMLFGFCSGQVARISTRPRLCAVSICVAALPCEAAAAAHGGWAYVGLALMFLAFTAGGLESAGFIYVQTRQRIATNLELAAVASIDPLTQLSNRLGLRRAIEQLSGQEEALGALIAVHCFDLDGFKVVNDQFGHSAGDALLIELARRVACVVCEGDLAARVGGDEFVVLQTGVRHADETEMFARRLYCAVTAPYDALGKTITIGTSIGSCMGRVGLDAIDDLLGAADQRMYRVKRDGGGVLTTEAIRFAAGELSVEQTILEGTKLA